MQTQQADFRAGLSKHQEKVQKVIESINSAVGDTDKISFRFGQTSFNPNYAGSTLDSNSIVAHARVHISTDLDNFSKISNKISQNGFRIENLYVSAVRTEQVERTFPPAVLIVNGASDLTIQSFTNRVQ